MRKALFLMAVFCFSVFASQAQKPADFSGNWTLDMTRSKLGERTNIHSQTLTVTQTAKEIKIVTATKRAGPPSGAPAGAPGGGRGFGGDTPVTYTLDGKEVKSEIDGPGGNKVPVTSSGRIAGGKMTLSRTMTFNGPNGPATSSTKETWELAPDGKTLTITTERVSFRGTDTTTRVFTKG